MCYQALAGLNCYIWTCDIIFFSKNAVKLWLYTNTFLTPMYNILNIELLCIKLFILLTKHACNNYDYACSTPYQLSKVYSP